MKEELEQAFAAIKNGEEEQARVILARMLKDDPDYVPGWVLLSKLAPNRIQKAAFLDKILALDPDHNYARQEMEALGAGADVTEEAESSGELEREPAPVELAVADVDAFAGEPAGEDRSTVYEEDVLQVIESGEAQPTASSIDADVEDEWRDDDDVVAEPAGVEVDTRMVVSTDPHDYEAQATGDTLPPWLASDEALLIDELAGQELGDAERMPPEPDLPDWLKEEPAVAWASEEVPVGGAVRLKEGTSTQAEQRTAVMPDRRPAMASTSTPPWLLITLSIALVVVFLLLIYFGIRLLG
jgi:hypothetical protein